MLKIVASLNFCYFNEFQIFSRLFLLKLQRKSWDFGILIHAKSLMISISENRKLVSVNLATWSCLISFSMIQILLSSIFTFDFDCRILDIPEGDKSLWWTLDHLILESAIQALNLRTCPSSWKEIKLLPAQNRK